MGFGRDEDIEEDTSDGGECLREFDSHGPEGGCVNDHTGCIWNDGNNTCTAPGTSLRPLEDDI